MNKLFTALLNISASSYMLVLGSSSSSSSSSSTSRSSSTTTTQSDAHDSAMGSDEIMTERKTFREPLPGKMWY